MAAKIIKPAQGIILISEPILQDYYFRQSVVLLAEHNEDGSFGIIINKPLDTKLNEVLPDFPDYNMKVYLGGPVSTENLYFIHTHPEIPKSLRILPGLFWGGDIDTIRDMIQAGKATENDLRFFVGYAGWHPKQLDREISEKSWVLSQTTVKNIITKKPEALWSNYIKNMGKDYAIWANFPADPSSN